jgi:cytochrome c oxidase assembly factor CtaG
MDFGGLSIPWAFKPLALAQAGFLALAYLAYVGPLRRRLAGPDLLWVYPVHLRQVACFLTALLLIAAFEATPLDELASRYSFAVHMVQHLLYTTVVPILILLGLPAWLVRRFISRVHRMVGGDFLGRAFRVVTHPLVAFGAFNGGLVFWHLPQYYGLVHESSFYHLLQHLTFLGTALLVWWPVVGPLPERRLPWLLRLGYLLALSIIPGVIGAFITFSGHLVYAYYGTTPKPFGLDPMTDQLIGGLIMKVFGSIPLWVVVGVDFMVTFAREEQGIPEA